MLTQLPLAQRKKLKYNDPQLDAYAAQMEAQYGLPPGIIVALKNNGEKSNSWQTSPAGAQGVMQLMPVNQRKFGVTDPADPVQSIEGAAKYLAATAKQYKGDTAAMVADYNGGPRQAKAVLKGGQPAAKETQDYLARVLPEMGFRTSPSVRGRAKPRATPGTPALSAAAAAMPAPPVVSAVDDILSRELVNLDAPATALQQLAAMQQEAFGTPAAEMDNENMPAWEQQLMSSALDMEVDSIRENAVSSFFGEDPVARVPLPAAIEEAINRFVANI